MLLSICSRFASQAESVMLHRAGLFRKPRPTRNLFISRTSVCTSVAAEAGVAAATKVKVAVEEPLAVEAPPQAMEVVVAASQTTTRAVEEAKVAEAAVEANRGSQKWAGRSLRWTGGLHPAARGGLAQVPDLRSNGVQSPAPHRF